MKAARANPVAPSTDWIARGHELLLAVFTGLLTLAPLTPTDAPAELGLFAVPSMLWMTLGVGTAVWLAFRKEQTQWDAVDLLAVAYLLWTAAATLAVRGVGDLRAAINSFFQTAAVVLVVVVGRRLLQTSELRRTALAVALALASGIAVLGVIQFCYFGPALRQEIREHPEAILQQFGITDPTSPEAKRTLDRARSPEPLGTFALTNSLAAYLVPWMIVLVSLGWRAWTNPGGSAEGTDRRWLRIAVALSIALIFAATLIFTKSRASMLALAMGLGLLALAQLRLGERVRWQWWLGGGVLALVLLVAGALANKLDRGLVLGASSSAQYRLQYWQSSWGLIRDHWLWGCGPGNFKSVYTFYKLPEASEEIGDPHNFVLEIWSTVGTPGVLLFGALLAAIFWKGVRPSPVSSQDHAPLVNKKAAWWMLGGALLALPCAWSPGMSPWWLMIPGLAAIAAYLPLRWLLDDRRPQVIAFADELVTSAALPLAAATLLINLLAAGGIGFPSVALPLALLLALIAGPPRTTSSQPGMKSPDRADANGAAWAAVVVSLGLCVACWCFCYQPVLQASNLESRAASGDSPLENLRSSVDADPFDPSLARNLARFELERLRLGDRDAAISLEAALEEAIRRNPRSYLGYQAAGDAHLAVYRQLKNRNLLQPAIASYMQAINHYPKFSYLHAELAWAQHVAGDDQAASASASEALRLDALCPHKDKQLSQQQLRDPGLSAVEATTPLDELMRSLADLQPRK